MNKSLEQHVAEWWKVDCQIEQLRRRMTELREQKADLDNEQGLIEERINQAANGRLSMMFEVADDTYVVLAWQEYSEDFIIQTLEEIQ